MDTGWQDNSSRLFFQPFLLELKEGAIRDHLGEMVRSTVEDTLNRMLEAEADRLCNSEKYQRSEARTDTRAGYYQRKLQTKAGEVNLNMPKLRRQTFETARSVCEGAKEDKAGWSGFLRHSKGRGLTGVRLFITDACMGLVESLAEFYPDTKWQRCIVHFYRNVFSVVPAKGWPRWQPCTRPSIPEKGAAKNKAKISLHYN